MIISHKYRFIFIHCGKTAGTSIQTLLSPLCGEDDVLTPYGSEEYREEGYVPRNYAGLFNPLPEILLTRAKSLNRTGRDLLNRRRFHNHIPAYLVQCRVAKKTWDSYFKFCVERNPWDKTISLYHFNTKRFKRYQDMSLDEFIRQRFHILNYPRYTDYHDSNRIIVDSVLDYGKLEEGLRDVFKDVGIPYNGLGIKAKGQYRTDKRHYREVLNEQQANTIREIYEKEIELFNYQF
jgi:hypothetical protein